jgi:murein DD-endopeptidase MepM/ murein hydrolase activator NlpD
MVLALGCSPHHSAATTAPPLSARAAPAPTAPVTETPPGSERSTPRSPAEQAVTLVRQFHGAERIKAYAGFGERFRAAVSEAQFVGILGDLERKLGRLTDVRVLDHSGPPALTTVVLAAFFEHGTRRYEVSLDAAGVVQGLFVRPFIEETPDSKGPADDYVAKRTYRVPAQGAWYVSNGGPTADTNQHVGNAQQWYALDLQRPDAEKKLARNDGQKNEDHFAWEQPVVAPADGLVVSVVNGIPDHGPDHRDRYFIPGNTVVLDHGGGEFSMLAHFREGSIVVKPGQRVKQGALLGKVGNSGNSSGPHIHWHLANDADPSRGHGLPIRFAPLSVNGVRVEAPAPLRGDTLDNAVTAPAAK